MIVNDGRLCSIVEEMSGIKVDVPSSLLQYFLSVSGESGESKIKEVCLSVHFLYLLGAQLNYFI